MNKLKIINDPIYGFIKIPNELVFDCIELPEFQRLRRIKQLGLTNLVYPGALHTRFHHVLGAMHLMCQAIDTLKIKNIAISQEEEEGAILAILLHDIGHGPFSHSLEKTLMNGVHHETISKKFMEVINQKLEGKLKTAIAIFEGTYPRKFLHQLVSSQLDMDRLDYLRRDSFYTGVSEGMVGIERIIQMLNVVNDELVIDEKGIFSVEKFIMARRFMYWQVYLHKTAITADQMMLKILERARSLCQGGKDLFGSPHLLFFLKQNITEIELNHNPDVLKTFSLLDDNDIMSAIKVWQFDDDFVLSQLSAQLINRKLLKIQLDRNPFSLEYIQKLKTDFMAKYSVDEATANFFVISGTLENNAYSSQSNQIKVLLKNGDLIDLAKASDTYPLSQSNEAYTKYFICYAK